MPTTIEKALVVLRKSDDGDALSQEDLYLVQCAVNGGLTETGLEVFDDLYRRVDEGRYVKPWLFDIEHLTINQAGYVRWKGQEVEHYTFYQGKTGSLHKQAIELARRCRNLEERGAEVNTANAVWNWKD